MKESEKIKSKISDLSKEKNELRSKIKPIPKAKKEKKFIGFSLTTGKERWAEKLIYRDKEITREKLKELRIAATKENEPHQNRIKEIDAIIPILKQRSNEARTNEILKNNRENVKGEIMEGQLIDEIIKVVLGNDIKRYSLRKLEELLGKNGYTIDHNTLQKKFKNNDFQILLSSYILRSKKRVRKETEKEKLESFDSWFKIHYLESFQKNINKRNVLGDREISNDIMEETNEFIDGIE